MAADLHSEVVDLGRRRWAGVVLRRTQHWDEKKKGALKKEIKSSSMTTWTSLGIYEETIGRVWDRLKANVDIDHLISIEK